MINALTIDLEDWYHGVGIPITEWDKYEKRLRIGCDRLLNLLAINNVKATFFALGRIIEDYPDLIQELISEGHEIGSHGYTHSELFYINETLFEEEIRQCVQLVAPFGVKYKGFRAPYFSIEKRTLWALPILKKHNFFYDASIFPGDSKRSGIPGYRQDIHLLKEELWEAPVSAFKILNFDFAAGGAYFRILPYKFFANQLRKINKHRSAVIYIHPWELDHRHPYLSFLSLRRRLPHYWNLDKTEQKLKRLLQDFEFCPLMEVINHQLVK